MITEQEKIVRESQGYDLGFELNGKKYWLNTNEWSAEKEKRFRKETGLCTLREGTGNKNLVVYDPEFFEVGSHDKHRYLHYKWSQRLNIPQPINMSSGYNMFLGCEDKHLDLSNWNVSDVVDMSYMFNLCEDLELISLEEWNVSNVISMSQMFADCSTLKSLPIAGWDTSKLKDMSYMFCNCRNLINLELGNWNVSQVDDVFGVFLGCSNISELDLSNWDLGHVKSCYQMFRDCFSLVSLNISNWNIKELEYMDSMFFDCRNLTDLNLAGWGNLHTEYTYSVFGGCEELYLKYSTKDDEELLHKIITDSNNNLSTMNLF